MLLNNLILELFFVCKGCIGSIVGAHTVDCKLVKGLLATFASGVEEIPLEGEIMMPHLHPCCPQGLPINWGEATVYKVKKNVYYVPMMKNYISIFQRMFLTFFSLIRL